MRTDINFYLARMRTDLKTFLKDKYSLDSALALFESMQLVGYDLEEVQAIIDENVHIQNAQIGGKNPRGTTKRKRKVARKPKQKKDDSGDFKAWKVPYVEPE